MASIGKGKGSKTAVWVIIVLLIIGLAGFGATNFGGTVRSVGQVGDTEIDVQRYARDLQTQLRSYSAQFGTNVTLAQAQELGIDRLVLQQLVSAVAFENEAANLGISAGDDEVRKEVLAITAFQGLDGKFDREAYRFSLEQSGLNETQFEDQLRAEISRSLLQGAVASGVRTPNDMTDALINFIGERRDFIWTSLGVDALETPVGEPSDADLQTYFDANPDDFMLPEVRKITYAWLTPTMLVDSVEIDEDALRALYDDRIDEFVKPERRLVERLVLGATAADAKSRLDAGEVTFEDLVAERELDLADIDLGDVSQDALGAAGEAVFANAGPGVVGPVETELGQAIFRVNAILSPQNTSFEDARADLVGEFALDRARRVIGDEIDGIDDLLAGGATVEELADETEMQLGQIDWSSESADDIAGYQAFRTAALAANVGDFPEAIELEDGGVFALRLDEVIEPRLPEFADARAQAEAGWTAAETTAALNAQADALVDAMTLGDNDAGAELDWAELTDITRDSFVPGTTPGFVTDVFDVAEGDFAAIPASNQVFLVRVIGTAGPDPENAELAQRREQLQAAAAQAIGTDILSAFSNAIETEAGISINQAAINAVHANFP